MREILFRGKRKDNDEWVEGLLWKKKYNTDKLFISCFPDKDDNEEVFVIDSKTVGQYTGLTDKNGKKIFEGDIVRVYYSDGLEETGVIAWSDIDIRYKFASPDGMAYGIDVTDVFEIIGNIHDNPEFLKGE